MKELKNKWVLITGAASGIGRKLALEFAGRGAKIIIADIDEEGMARTREKVEKMGGEAICLKADLRDPDQVAGLANQALARAGRVDVLVNNAGIAFVIEVKNMTVEEWERILAVNLRGPIQLTHHLLPHFLERGSGHIVNLASAAGLMGIPGMAAYSTTKFGLIGFSEALRLELDSAGIGVTAVCPGLVRTPLLKTSTIRGFKKSLRDPPSFATVSPEKVARMVVRAVEKNRARVVPTTPGGKLAMWLYRIWPGAVSYLARKAFEDWRRA